MTDHKCQASGKALVATERQPSHYTGSGLGNVYLVGVTYYVCQECGATSAEIPALPDLLAEIARVVVGKPSPLSGDEMRFLRKRLRLSSLVFARTFWISRRKHLSRLEHKKQAIQAGIRISF